MSVHGEFQRLLADLVNFLRRTGAPGCERWIETLELAAERGQEDIDDGTQRALGLLQGKGPVPTFSSDLEIEEFARLQEHLTAICQAALGR